MTEIEIKYSLDDEGERYFPATHVEAVEGLQSYLESSNKFSEEKFAEQEIKIKLLEEEMNKLKAMVEDNSEPTEEELYD